MHNCTICKKSFRKPSELHTHKYTHLNIRHHNCPLCTKAYFTKKHLKVHMIKHNEKYIYIHKCTICNIKEFITKDKLTRHIKTCNKIYKCYKCNKEYKRIKMRDKHQEYCNNDRNHTDNNINNIIIPNPSEINSKSNSNPPNPNVINKNIKCNICNKILSKKHINTHIKNIHHKIREYKCICGRSYGYKRLLKEHKCNK